MADLRFDEARALLDAVFEEAASRRCAVSVTIVDTAGGVVLKARQDDADRLSIDMSEAKARTAALLRMSTGPLQELAAPGGILYGLAEFDGGRLVLLPGGEPVTDGSSLRGALGVSGATPAEDREMALAAIARWAA